MIHGIGIDAVDVSRFKSAMERRGQRFLDRLFTPAELDYCLKKKAPEVCLAARFAAKISFIKAMGGSFDLRKIEIKRDADGRPSVLAMGLSKSFRVNVSITHDGDISMAETVVEKVE
jgi:holo-[acyl-carrier protein] synthase